MATIPPENISPSSSRRDAVDTISAVPTSEDVAPERGVRLAVLGTVEESIVKSAVILVFFFNYGQSADLGSWFFFSQVATVPPENISPSSGRGDTIHTIGAVTTSEDVAPERGVRFAVLGTVEESIVKSTVFLVVGGHSSTPRHKSFEDVSGKGLVDQIDFLGVARRCCLGISLDDGADDHTILLDGLTGDAKSSKREERNEVLEDHVTLVKVIRMAKRVEL